MQDGCTSCGEVECVSRAEACQQWADNSSFTEPIPQAMRAGMLGYGEVRLLAEMEGNQANASTAAAAAAAAETKRTAAGSEIQTKLMPTKVEQRAKRWAARAAIKAATKEERLEAKQIESEMRMAAAAQRQATRELARQATRGQASTFTLHASSAEGSSHDGDGSEASDDDTTRTHGAANRPPRLHLLREAPAASNPFESRLLSRTQPSKAVSVVHGVRRHQAELFRVDR